MLRRADIALGGDGQIGLPFWGWEELDINGEIAPKVRLESTGHRPPWQSIGPQLCVGYQELAITPYIAQLGIGPQALHSGARRV